jgi:hypothetical protein
LQADPFSGRLFLFSNRRRTALKILSYDSCGVLNYVELPQKNCAL